LFTFTRKSPKVQRLVRLFQTLLFMSIVTGIILAVVLTPLTIGDVFAVGLALIPTGWGLLSVNIFPSLSLGEFVFSAPQPQIFNLCSTQCILTMLLAETYSSLELDLCICLLFNRKS
jgi:hypothetical protein